MCVSQTCDSSEKKVELTAIARTHKFVSVPHKKKHLRDTHVSQTCVSSEKKVELTAIARTHKFVSVPHKKKHLRDTHVSQTCVSSEKKLILARIGLFGDYVGLDFTICLKYRAQLDVRFRPSGS